MCGIAGVVGEVVSRETLQEMADAMIHRGPDDEGYYQSDFAGLAFRRLAIIDIVHGHQPMANEDGNVQVVFNGEIYNHQLLRRELEARGHRFATDHSDTEVIVHGWEEWGYDLFEKLNGMFGIAICDERERSLILARDRFGIKPLYFSEGASGSLVFSSEVKPILASGLVPRAPNPSGILEYFTFQNLWRDQTMFRGVKQLAAGMTLTWKDGAISLRQYWNINFPRGRKGSLTDLAAEHRELLSRCVGRQIQADVPVMSYLSGGIDSTAITVAAQQRDPSIRAYSCIFDLTDVAAQEQVYDEREFSRAVAAEYDLDRVELMIAPDALSGMLSSYVWHLEDLRMGMGYVNYLIAERVAQDGKVVLSGTGGDEYHGGYVGRYNILGLTGEQPPAWRVAKHRLMEALGKGGALEPALMSDAARRNKYRAILNAVFTPSMAKTYFTPEFLALAGEFDATEIMDSFIAEANTDDWRDRVLYVDAKTYLTGLLMFEDKVSMAHSLEARVPLLDNELIDFLLDVPWQHFISDGVGKVIFRESVRPWVPEVIYNKPKMGFGPPDVAWYRTALRDWIDNMLSHERLAKRGVFNPKPVRALCEAHFSGAANHTYVIWSLLNFESWCEAFDFYS